MGVYSWFPFADIGLPPTDVDGGVELSKCVPATACCHTFDRVLSVVIPMVDDDNQRRRRPAAARIIDVTYNDGRLTTTLGATLLSSAVDVADFRLRFRTGHLELGKEELMSDNAGPKSSSSDFEWPAWHGQDGDETQRSATESAPPSDASTDSEPGEPEHETYALSNKPPPVIDAFPEQKVPYEPPPEPEDDPGVIPWPLTVTVILASLTVVALIAVLVAVINGGDSSGPSTAAPSTTPQAAIPSPTEAAPPPVTVTVTSTTEETETVTSTPPTTATPTYYPPAWTSLQRLQQQAQSDHDVVLRGATNPDRWMPQLGSKKLGTVDHDKSYGYDDILADYYQLKQKYPGARLLRSADWSTFGESDYWVTVANITSPTAVGALNWCRDNVGSDNEGCYAKLISTTHPVDGSTAYQ
jgi:hypothetical protein